MNKWARKWKNKKKEAKGGCLDWKEWGKTKPLWVCEWMSEWVSEWGRTDIRTVRMLAILAVGTKHNTKNKLFNNLLSRFCCCSCQYFDSLLKKLWISFRLLSPHIFLTAFLFRWTMSFSTSPCLSLNSKQRQRVDNDSKCEKVWQMLILWESPPFARETGWDIDSFQGHRHTCRLYQFSFQVVCSELLQVVSCMTLSVIWEWNRMIQSSWLVKEQEMKSQSVHQVLIRYN